MSKCPLPFCSCWLDRRDPSPLSLLPGISLGWRADAWPQIQPFWSAWVEGGEQSCLLQLGWLSSVSKPGVQQRWAQTVLPGCDVHYGLSGAALTRFSKQAQHSPAAARFITPSPRCWCGQSCSLPLTAQMTSSIIFSSVRESRSAECAYNLLFSCLSGGTEMFAAISGQEEDFSLIAF